MMKIHLIAWMLSAIIVYATPATSTAQTPGNPATTFRSESVPLATALKKVGELYKTQFIYEKSLLEGKDVSYTEELIKGKSIEEVLKAILYPNGLVFLYVKENYYTIVSKESINQIKGEDKGSSEMSYASVNVVKDLLADQKVRGRVTDSIGKPIGGVSVNVKGTTVGTSTNANGEYSISVPDNGSLVFSSVGYTIKEVAVNGQNVINVSLSEQAKVLNEVVMTGYSSQRKKDITGAVAVVDVGAMKSIPTGSAEQALQGQASGVTVIGSGAPGGRNDIFIRGVTSFGNSQPLIIVDGVQGSLTDLNINDIASMQVLKDAGAASIYGVRGSNGPNRFEYAKRNCYIKTESRVLKLIIFSSLYCQ